MPRGAWVTSPAYLAGMKPLALPSLLLLYRPLLLERSYGGAGEGLGILIMLGLGLLASTAGFLALLALGHWANKEYGESFQKLLKGAGMVAVLLYVVLLLSSISSH